MNFQEKATYWVTRTELIKSFSNSVCLCVRIMSFTNNTVGGICDLHGIVSVEWKIPNYFQLSQTTDGYYESPPFLLSRSTWCIRIYPNGQRYNHTVESFGLFLRKRDVSVSQPVTATLGIKNPNGTVYKSGTFSHSLDVHTYGWAKFMAKLTLLRLKPKIAPEGILTLFCVARLSSDVEVATQTTPVDSTDVLINDFRSLFLSGEKSDVVFKVNGRELRAHKLILQTRSPVLDAMFQHDWKENKGVVQITDCDSSTFQEFLQFLYTGKIEYLTSDNVTSLYSIADKYQVKELQERCADFMKNNLTIDTVCDIIAVAYQHQEEELKISAKELLIRNIKKVLPTEKWKSFMAENSGLAVEILMTVIPGNHS